MIGIDASRAFADKPTGTERYADEMIKEMVAENEMTDNKIVLYVRPNTQVPVQMSKFRNVTVRLISLKYLWTQVGLAVRTWLDGLDVLWVPAHTLPVLGKWWVPMVVTVHGIEYEWLPAYENRLQRWYLPWSTFFAVKRANRIIAVSQFTANQLVERLGADPRKIEVISEGFSGGGRARKDLSGVLCKYGLKEKKYILFIGTVQPRKNLARLVRVFGRLGNVAGARIKLVIAGKLGWMYDEVVTEIGASSRKKDIVITGYISDEEREMLLAGALVYVQPSITEGFGLPVLEAMSSGVPVVSSNGGALSEVGGKAAIYFDPVSETDMARQIGRLIKDGSLRRKLIAAGLETAKGYGWGTAAKTMLKVLTYRF